MAAAEDSKMTNKFNVALVKLAAQIVTKDEQDCLRFIATSVLKRDQFDKNAMEIFEVLQNQQFLLPPDNFRVVYDALTFMHRLDLRKMFLEDIDKSGYIPEGQCKLIIPFSRMLISVRDTLPVNSDEWERLLFLYKRKDKGAGVVKHKDSAYAALQYLLDKDLLANDKQALDNFAQFLNDTQLVKGEKLVRSYLTNHPEIPDRMPVPSTEESNSEMLSGLQQHMNECYKNWIKLGQALNLLNESLQQIARQKMEEFHKTLKLKIKGECKSNCKPGEEPPETCDICTKWKESISEQHSNLECINWSNVDPKLWPTDKWEVAKMFMPRGQKPGKYDPDISSILNLMQSCKVFHSSEQMRKKIDEKENSKEVIKLIHSGDMKVKEDDLDKYFDIIINMFDKLQDDGNDVRSNKQLVIELKSLEYEVDAAGMLSLSSKTVDVRQLQINLLTQKISALHQKRQNGDSHEEADTLPSPTPRKRSRRNKQDGNVEQIARELARDYITYKVHGNSEVHSDYEETLRRIGDEVDSKYDISLSEIVRKLKYSPERDGSDGFTSTLDTMFEEGPVNWGRVIMVYVFGARLAKYCVENKLEDQIETIIKYTGEYVALKLSSWINKQGGWDNFVLNFRQKDWKEDFTFKALAVTGASCGAVALIRLVSKT